MKLLGTFQLATLLAAASITTQASKLNFQPAKYRMVSVRRMIKLGLNCDLNKLVLYLDSVYAIFDVYYLD